MNSEQNAVHARIAELDLGPIKFKLAHPDDGQGWERDKINQVETEYRRFLALTALGGEQVIVPSKDVDKFWHAHILDTRKYAQDCETTFGYFLHHFPYLGTREVGDVELLSEAYQATNLLYESHFGARPSVTGQAQDASVCGGSCGAGCSSSVNNSSGSTAAGVLKRSVDMKTRPSLQ